MCHPALHFLLLSTSLGWMVSTPALLRWYLHHPPPGFPMYTLPFWSTITNFLHVCSVTRPVTREELQLLPEIIAVSHDYAEHMAAVTATAAAAAAEAWFTNNTTWCTSSSSSSSGDSGGSRSNSGSRVSEGCSIFTMKMMEKAVHQTGGKAVSRLHALLCSDVLQGSSYQVVDALCGPAVTAEVIANLAVCCEYLHGQLKQQQQVVPDLNQQHKQQDQQQQQHMGGAIRDGRPQATTSGLASFRELALAPPAHGLVWVPGRQVGRAFRLGAYIERFQTASKGAQGTQGMVACALFTVSSLLKILSVAAEENALNYSFGTAIHSMLLLEAFVLVGAHREQQGLPVDDMFLNGSVMPILTLLKNSLESSKRTEREAFVASSRKLLLSVLQLLLRKLDGFGGEGSGVGGEESPSQKQKLWSQRMVLKLVIEILTETGDVNGQSKYVFNLADAAAGSSSSSSGSNSSIGSSSGFGGSRKIGDVSSSSSRSSGIGMGRAGRRATIEGSDCERGGNGGGGHSSTCRVDGSGAVGSGREDAWANAGGGSSDEFALSEGEDEDFADFADFANAGECPWIVTSACWQAVCMYELLQADTLAAFCSPEDSFCNLCLVVYIGRHNAQGTEWHSHSF